MENSAYEILVTSVYVFVFIIATSITIYLFLSTITLADKVYEYGKVVSSDSIIETTSAPTNNTITGSELLTYYYNYKSSDKYGTSLDSIYNFTNIEPVSNINLNDLYTLTYKRSVTGQKIEIEAAWVSAGPNLVTAVYEAEPPIIDNITTNPSVFPQTIPPTPVQLVNITATAHCTNLPSENSIVSYCWTINYDDSRPDWTITTQVAQLLGFQYGDNLKFIRGKNIISVTAMDSFGTVSAIAVKEIIINYYEPVINYLVEINSLVSEGGSITGPVTLQFLVNATSMNDGGYITKYEWYVNDIQKINDSSVFNFSFPLGANKVKVKVTDSENATSEKEFLFNVIN
ncbi:MAG: hypothetical protein PHD15_01675 [Clostridia bacterium]|nr:hypothetical protein [Clostridia bacterium]MDD4386460.1 hypothetical protein [Clostridia bacterium]